MPGEFLSERAKMLAVLGGVVLFYRLAQQKVARDGVLVRAFVGAGDWKSETADLGKPAQDVIQKVIDTETGARQLQQIAAALKAAGYTQAAAAVSAKAPGGGASATSGWW
jgi:hypothetical protein